MAQTITPICRLSNCETECMTISLSRATKIGLQPYTILINEQTSANDRVLLLDVCRN